MSGCYIAAWTDNTGRQVGHIGTIESVGKTQPPNSTVKQTFSAMMPNNVKAYNPMALTRKYPQYDGWWNVLSLVTSDSRFYSILLLKHRRNDPLITCAGIKSCAGIGTKYDAAAFGLRRQIPYRSPENAPRWKASIVGLHCIQPNLRLRHRRIFPL
ncbi:hypothetical protein Metal_1719 [Methylomicrobium album BG8]|uniref:Uncharacterized protein n=2 Tax=Methylococcaceae TaxID=403 RepID=H8GMT7_METAL|nr:hypothetical protein Metal_1719 [Methylomicrobium album BG8]